MKTTTSALLLGLSALIALACSVENEKPIAAPPHYDVAAAPPNISDTATSSIQGVEQQGSEEKLGARSEAFAQRVPTELERQLEANYQAAIRRTDVENGLSNRGHQHAAVDFSALFEKIRNTMPPGREALMIQYISAASQVADPGERDALMKRLGSSELDNVR